MATLVGRIVAAGLALGVLLAGAGAALAETTLEKIGRTGTFTVGTRTGSPPFGFIDKNNNWGGFSVDLAKLVHANVEKKIGKPVKFELKESTPATRIPLLTSGAVDLIAGTMTITRARRDSLDFSAVFFVTGAQFLVKKGSPIRGVAEHRRQAHRRPAGLHQREGPSREVPAGPAGRLPRPARGVHRAGPGQD